MRRIKPLLAVLLLTALLVTVFVGGILSPAVWADIGAPRPGTVQRAVSYTYLTATAGVTGTTYTDVPNTTAGGLDVTRIADWHAADVFVTADIAGTGTVTVTPQLSPDQSNWADADYQYVAQSGTVVNSGAVTSTITTASSIATQTYQAILTADGTEVVRVPLAGEYLRFKIERVGTITATVLATLRND